MKLLLDYRSEAVRCGQCLGAGVQTVAESQPVVPSVADTKLVSLLRTGIIIITGTGFSGQHLEPKKQDKDRVTVWTVVFGQDPTSSFSVAQC